MTRPKNFIDFTNTKLGRLLIIEYLGNKMWSAVCDCGYEFKVCSQSLTTQNQRRCKFCYYNDKKTHGISGTPEYQAWKHIKERCYDEEDRMYPNYGGRGIIMCDEWLGENGASNFIKNVGERPTKKHSIDRINVDGNYEPNNVKWSTKREQMRNRTTNVFITFNNKTMILQDWSEETGISSSALRYRIKANWSIEKMLTTPSIKNKK